MKRYSELYNVKEIDNLESNMDFRKEIYRRSVFLRFYDFHIRYRSHPGCVYYIFPYLKNKLLMKEEQTLWFAFINGNTQNSIMSYIIYRKFPDLEYINLRELNDWFFSNWKKFDFDTDRKYQKKLFPKSTEVYINLIKKYKGSQKKMLEVNNDKDNFMKIWNFVRKNYFGFGRLSTFSYLEYLKIFNIKINCNNLFFNDIDGSRSHRNGLLKVLGRDDMISDNVLGKYEDKYTKDDFIWLDKEAKILLEEAREFSLKNENPYIEDVNYFTMESALCTYKSWHKPNRRYPNVYNDMFFNRIKKAEKLWNEKFNIFWECRKECVPKNLLLEFNEKDPGLVPKKQNHYLNTGQVIMMENDFECFKNDERWKNG